MEDLNTIIEDAVTDAELPAEAPESTPVVEVAPEAAETPSDAPVDDTPESTEVPSPGAKTPADDFEKKFGIAANSASGRENRIPYSRMKKITEKAVNEAVAAKVKEFEGTFNPKLAESEAKVKDYEGKLGEVARFEDVMVNHSDQFLQMLSTLPAYQPFFKAVNEAFAAQKAGGTAPEAPVAEVDDMPQPDQALSDGTMVYSLDGLKALNVWNREQARKEVMSEVEKRYKPLEDEWTAHQKVQAVIPQVQAQIADARTWPQFNENEEAIVKALQTTPNLSLERAYQQVVYPKLIADRGKMREEILKEVKQAPRATSAPSGVKVAPPAPAGPRSLEDIVREAAQTLK